MMEKEAGKLEESQFPSLWEAKTVGNKEKRYSGLDILVANVCIMH